MTTVLSRANTRPKRSRWRSPVSLDTVSTLAVITVLLLMPLFALDSAGWSVHLNIVQPALVAAVFFGLILARSRFGEFAALVVSLLYAICANLFFAALYQNLPPREALLSVLARCYDWGLDLVSGGINTDPLILTLLVGILFWFLAFSANWHIFRIDRVWRVILPPGLILLVNMIFLGADDELEGFLFVFLLMALLLIIRSNLEHRRWNWRMRAARTPNFARRQFAIVGLLLSLLSLLFAWSLPSGGLQDRLDSFQRFLASDPLEELAEVWNRLFAPIEGDGPATTDFYGADLLNLGGAISLGDDIVFEVEAPVDGTRYYWRSRAFERYADGQWSPSADLRITDRTAPLEIPMNSEVIGQRRRAARQVFTIGSGNSRIFYSAPQPQAFDQSGRIDFIYTDKPDNTSMNVSVVRPLKVMRGGERYSVTSLVSEATADELRAAPRDYPDWVSGPNLYVGARNQRVQALAESIIREARATNPYDQAKAIERWLRQNIAYNESISAPPPNVDTVEWALFQAREGYCTYFATSMIVMLRQLGVPARMAAGFSQGTFDESRGRFVVRERDAHTWVEVYFPGYGWIEFEPTSAEAPILREGDDAAEESEEPLTPAPTSTPTPTPSPLPTPTPLPSPTRLPDQDAQEQGLPPPSATPSPTPSAPPPSPTPVILPTVVPPISPDNPPPLSLLQPMIFLALVVALSLLILLILALLLFWWWEWRGMGGLSPISRAYARLERYIGLIGLRPGPNQTTLEKRRELQRRVPAAREPIQTISDLYTRERYGGGAEADDSPYFAERAEKAWYRTRGNILRRWLARFIPFRRRD